jgi:hypothetical protein
MNRKAQAKIHRPLCSPPLFLPAAIPIVKNHIFSPTITICPNFFSLRFLSHALQPPHLYPLSLPKWLIDFHSILFSSSFSSFCSRQKYCRIIPIDAEAPVPCRTNKTAAAGGKLWQLGQMAFQWNWRGKCRRRRRRHDKKLFPYTMYNPPFHSKGATRALQGMNQADAARCLYLPLRITL